MHYIGWAQWWRSFSVLGAELLCYSTDRVSLACEAQHHVLPVSMKDLCATALASMLCRCSWTPLWWMVVLAVECACHLQKVAPRAFPQRSMTSPISSTTPN
jgi:hypothetical protein